MVGVKKQQQQRSYSSKLRNINNSSQILTKRFQIFVTDFLVDSGGLPIELKDYVLVDGNNTDISLSNQNEVLKQKSLESDW